MNHRLTPLSRESQCSLLSLCFSHPCFFPCVTRSSMHGCVAFVRICFCDKEMCFVAKEKELREASSSWMGAT